MMQDLFSAPPPLLAAFLPVESSWPFFNGIFELPSLLSDKTATSFRNQLTLQILTNRGERKARVVPRGRGAVFNQFFSYWRQNSGKTDPSLTGPDMAVHSPANEMYLVISWAVH